MAKRGRPKKQRKIQTEEAGNVEIENNVIENCVSTKKDIEPVSVEASYQKAFESDVVTTPVITGSGVQPAPSATASKETCPYCGWETVVVYYDAGHVNENNHHEVFTAQCMKCQKFFRAIYKFERYEKQTA